MKKGLVFLPEYLLESEEYSLWCPAWGGFEAFRLRDMKHVRWVSEDGELWELSE